MEQNNQVKHKNIGLRVVIALLLAITIVASCLGMYAWAKYITTVPGTATAQIAKWNFDLKLKEGKQNAVETTGPIDMASTMFNHVVNGKIAPGTSGLFYVIIDTTETEVDCQYDVSISLTNCPRNIKFYRGTDETGEVLSLGGENTTTRTLNFSRYLAVKKDVNGTITNENGKYEEPIYLVWDYSGTVEGSAATYDQWDTVDSNIGTTTMTITATGTEMLENLKPSLVSQVKAANYGQAVNYSVTVGNNELDNWKIFYNDGTYVYMIYGDYLPSSAIDTTKTGMTRQSGTTYNAYWANGSLTAPENKSAVATLTNTNNWSQLLTAELANKGATAQGGVTTDIWAKSWNAKGYTPIYVDSETSSMGDLISTSKPVASDSCGVDLASDQTGYGDSLYFPKTEQISESGPPCMGYWLASPSAYDDSYVMVVYYDGRVNPNNCYPPIFACRPVVKLPNTVLGEYTNGAWNIE